MSEPKCPLHGFMEKFIVEADVTIYHCEKCGSILRLPNVRTVARIYRGKVTG